MAEIITKKQLENASLDADSLEVFVSGSDIEDVLTRLGQEYPTLAKLVRVLMETGGWKAYQTAAELLATTPTVSPSVGYAFDTKKMYLWNGSTWSDEGLSQLDQAISFSKGAVAAVSAVEESLGYYTGVSTGNVISTPGSAYGFEVQKGGKIIRFKTQIAGSSATVALQVYRPRNKNLELISTQTFNLVQALSVVDLANPLTVNKGDIVALKYISGAFVRGLVIATGEPLGSYTATTAGTNVGDIATLNRSRNKPELLLELVSSDIDKKPQSPELISPLTINTGSLENGTTTTNGEFFTDTTTTGSLTYAYGTSKSVSVFSQLKQIKYKARVTGVNAKFTIAIIEKINDSFIVRDLIPASASADSNGIVIATKEHFGEVFVPKDGHVMILGITTSDAVLGKTGTTAGWYYVSAASLSVGANVSVLFSTSNPISLEISLLSVEKNLSNRVANLENNLLTPAPLLHTKRLIKEAFLGTTLPANWTETGSWTVNNGLKSPATGGWTTVAKHAEYSAMAKRVYRAKFLVANASSVFGICTTPIEAGSGSAVAMIDGVQNKLIIYLWDGTNAGTSVASVAIPALVANRSYYLEVEKNGYFSTVTLIDTISQTETKVEYSATSPYIQFHGQGGVMFISGDITVQYFSFNALYPNEPHSIIVGDSNSERAANVLPNQTWAFKYAEMRHLNADVIVAGRSGDETPNFLKRKQFDLLVWKPKYVIWALGTNDTSQATWRTNMTQNIADTVALGAEPILVTQIPRTDSQALRTAMNDDIRNGYFGNYRYVDFAKAVSLNNDGVTWDPLYNSGDNVHVNPAGQQKLLQQLLSDAPDVLY